jgi:hypothetical protein
MTVERKDPAPFRAIPKDVLPDDKRCKSRNRIGFRCDLANGHAGDHVSSLDRFEGFSRRWGERAS